MTELKLAVRNRCFGYARGKLGDRKRLPPDEPRVVLAQKMFADKTVSIQDICDTMKISRATLYRYVKTGTERDTFNETPNSQ